MILNLDRASLLKRPELIDQMHRGRRDVFHDRLGWSVILRGDWEVDDYDDTADPTYVLSVRDGALDGSLRILPTTGPNMLARDFAACFDPPLVIREADTWECTRFCVHPSGGRQERRTSAELLVGLCRLCLADGIACIVGLYERKMERVYARISWSPRELASSAPGGSGLVAGRWTVSQAALAAMLSRHPMMTIRVESSRVA